jgi:DNA gyrase subunit A
MTDTPVSSSQPVAIEHEMKRSYLDYAMSVIVSRAIPDVRDGLKPVHRRILFAMLESGCTNDKPYKKSARIVGEVMGKYHPHGDSAIYDALVRMAQDFSMSVMLVDGQGNFGSMDGDKPAAMRYTESRLAKVAMEILADIDESTVDFQENYDGSEQEPKVLPSRFPNILVNGGGGIAVGMATNIPTFNLGEVVDATCLLLDNPLATNEDVLTVMPGPDFPTGGLILGRGGIRNMMETGRGSIIMRARTDIEEANNGRQTIIVQEIPYQVNKARMIERIAELVREKRIEGISDLRDESDSDGVRVVIEVKKDHQADVVLNQLYRYSPLQTSFGANMLALDQGQPKLLTPREILLAFIEFREEVIYRRTIHRLSKSRERAHVLIGLSIAVANIDEIIRLIRQSPDPATAREALMSKDWAAESVAPLIALVEDRGNILVSGRTKLTEAQAKAILDLRLHRLTGLEQAKIDDELGELGTAIRDFLDILGSRERIRSIIRDELVAVKTAYPTPRRSRIEDGDFDQDIEDLIQREDMVVTVTMGGYIKRVPLADYRSQKRGGKGRSGMNIHEDDITTELFVANTHTPVLFFSSKGRVFKLKVYKLPQGTPQSRGKALINILPLEQGETIQTFMPLPENENLWDQLHIMFATSKGNVRRNTLEDFHDVRSNGKIAIRLEDGDTLIGVRTCTEDDNVLLAAHSGKCVRFPVQNVRVFKSRTSDGVRGMLLAKGDQVISMAIVKDSSISIEDRDEYLRFASAKRRGEEYPTKLAAETITQLETEEQFILTITENGYGKRTSAYEYRITNRGGQGIVNIETSERNGAVVASFPVDATDHIMMMTDKGQMIRTTVKDIRIAGRNTQGVTLFRVSDDEHVVSAVRIADGSQDADEEGEAAETPEAAAE